MTTTTTGILPYRLQLEEGERLGALDDPGPLPEGMHQNPTLLYAANALISRLRELPGVFVDFNTFVYYDRTNRNRRVSPDLYVALGVDTVAIRERHGYLIWEVGKPPDFRTRDCIRKHREVRLHRKARPVRFIRRWRILAL